MPKHSIISHFMLITLQIIKTEVIDTLTKIDIHREKKPCPFYEQNDQKFASISTRREVSNFVQILINLYMCRFIVFCMSHFNKREVSHFVQILIHLICTRRKLLEFLSFCTLYMVQIDQIQNLQFKYVAPKM